MAPWLPQVLRVSIRGVTIQEFPGAQRLKLEHGQAEEGLHQGLTAQGEQTIHPPADALRLHAPRSAPFVEVPVRACVVV